jgi:hypothetical protein
MDSIKKNWVETLELKSKMKNSQCGLPQPIDSELEDVSMDLSNLKNREKNIEKKSEK